MEAHLVLGNAGLNVESYGTGTTVRLPGRSAMEVSCKILLIILTREGYRH